MTDAEELAEFFARTYAARDDLGKATLNLCVCLAGSSQSAVMNLASRAAKARSDRIAKPAIDFDALERLSAVVSQDEAEAWFVFLWHIEDSGDPLKLELAMAAVRRRIVH